MSEYITFDQLREELRKKPDLVEVVRCRDCKHYTDGEVEYRHYCNEWCGQVKPDGFCAWGKVVE